MCKYENECGTCRAMLIELSVLPHLLHRGPRVSAIGGAACGEAAAAGEGVGRTVADQVGRAIGAL